MRLARALPIAATVALALPAAASADVLWNQTGNDASSGSASYTLPPPYNAGSQEMADDFLVSAPSGQHWTIDEVDVHGTVSSGEPDFVRVAFYVNNGVLPADAPFVEQAQLTPLTGLDTGNFAVALNPPVALSAGTYWVAVQAIEGGGTWEWTSGVTQSLHAAAIREAGAHGYNCPDWTSVNDCFHPPPGPDQSFELLGSVVSDAGAPPPADIKPPALTASAPRSESIKSGFVTVTDKTDEAATDTATGTISVSGATKVYRLAKATATHPAGQVRLKLKIPKKALKVIRHALAHHRKAVARVRVGSQDVAGNRAKARTLRIKLKR